MKNIKKKDNKRKKKKKGFTLIELLAVIIILGVLMIIAIPSVTEYIQTSRKSAYIKTANQYISGARTEVNSAEIPMFDTNVTYYLPASCVSLEKGGNSPFGELEEAYIVVTYNGSGYDYYWTSRDTSNMGVLLTSEDLLVDESILSGIESINTSIGVGDREYILLIDSNCKGEGETKPAEVTIPEKSKLDASVDDSEDVIIGQANKFIMLNNNNQYILLNDSNSEYEIEIYDNNSIVNQILNENVDVSSNVITISNTSNYDGVYTIYDDGYLEKDNVVIAKQESKWVTLNESSFMIIHKGMIYLSSDGNSLDEEYFHLDIIKPTIEEAVYGEDGFEANGGSYYKFADVEENNVKLENIYDLLALQNFNDRINNLWDAAEWLANGKYRYWGGSARDFKIEDSFITKAYWLSSDVDFVQELKLYRVENNTKKPVKLTNSIIDGVYLTKYIESYYYKDVKTENIVFVDDYPFAYETDMTWREWIHSEYSNDTSLSDYTGEPMVYIPKENLDKKVSLSSGYGMLSRFIIYLENNYKFDTGFDYEAMIYCTGTINLPTVKESDYSLFGYNSDEYEFVGWQWDGGIATSSIESYDLINYYLEKNEFSYGSASTTFTAVFQKK